MFLACLCKIAIIQPQFSSIQHTTNQKHTMKTQTTATPFTPSFFSYHKIGGLHFVRIGSLSFSFCITSKR